MTLIMTVKSLSAQICRKPPVNPTVSLQPSYVRFHPLKWELIFSLHTSSPLSSGSDGDVKHRGWSEQSEIDFPHRERAIVACWRALCGFAICKLSIWDELEHGRNFPADFRDSFSRFPPQSSHVKRSRLKTHLLAVKMRLISECG